MIQSLPHHSVGFRFSSDLSLLTLKGVGLNYIDSHAYSWDNRTRKDTHCLIQYCIDGEGTLEIDNIYHPILPGDAFIINIPGKSRYFLPEHSDHWEFLYLEFTKECLPLMLKIHRNIGPVIHLKNPSGITEQMFLIYKKALNNELKTFFENAKLAMTFWLDITEYVLTLATDELSKIDIAKSYIDQNYFHENLNLDMIAENSNLSKYYLCKEFKRKYGIPPGKYLKELRISQACRLLSTSSDFSMMDIAHMIGYSNDSYFGKVFKAVKGITPDQFRKQTTQYDLVRDLYETPKYISSQNSMKQ